MLLHKGIHVRLYMQVIYLRISIVYHKEDNSCYRYPEKKINEYVKSNTAFWDGDKG